MEAQEAKAGVQLAPQQRDAVLLRPSSGASRRRSLGRACAALVPPSGCDVSAGSRRLCAAPLTSRFGQRSSTRTLCVLWSGHVFQPPRTATSCRTHFFYASLVASGSAEDTSQGRGRLWEPSRDDWLLFIVLWLEGVVFLLVCVITRHIKQPLTWIRHITFVY